MTFKELRELSGMNMTQFAKYFNIPYRTIQDWEYENRKCPVYVLELMRYKLEKEGKTETRA
jgi:DNA-binding transcriptional regulator YiaG